MRVIVVAGWSLALAACTLLVPIDDDLTSGLKGPNDGGPDSSLVNVANDGSTDAGIEATTPYDSGEPFGPARDGCPNGVSLDPDLDAYYPFDETEGSVLHDCSQKAHDLDALNEHVPKWSTDGHIHGAADFDGVDGCFGTTDSNLNKFEFQPFTISVWVQPRQFFEDNADKSGRWIVSHKASPKGWHVGTDNPSRLELDLEWNVPGGSKTEISAISEPNTWVHFAVTYSNSAQEAAVYKNGVLTEKVSDPAKVPANFGTGANVFFHVGCRNIASGVFDGKIDELRIYPRVITEEQIRQLAAAR